ncbi:MAG: methyltransferase domain-containing protein [Clostridiales bacterium]|nr:methyltransferase domain-containing protein [Clostridiales bacterium]
MNDVKVVHKMRGQVVRERRFFFMHHNNYLKYYNDKANWAFEDFDIETESLTDWDLYDILRKHSTPESVILDLGTGGGETLLKHFPDCKKILGTDFSPEMIKTAQENLRKSWRQNINFKVMDNLHMDVPDNCFDIVVARHTITAPEQIIKCLKPGGYLLIRGVDKYDCWSLKLIAGGGQSFRDIKPVSITDYESLLRNDFEDVELVPIHEREYFKDKETFKDFLKQVPILEEVTDEVVDEYAQKNTYDGRIRLLRGYYGITARKPI